MFDPSLIVARLRGSTAVVLAEIDREGRLQDANAGFLRLVPAPVQTESVPDVSAIFVSPGFQALVALYLSAPDQKPFYQGPLSLRDTEGSCRSLRGSVSRSGMRLVLVAEYDVELLEAIHDRAGALERELAEARAHLRRREEELRVVSMTDDLTGIPNRRRFDQALAAETARASRYGGTFALVIADLDHFKRINDEFGHDAGDTALRAFANLIQGQTRDTDVAARIGGEEFVVLMPETEAEPASRCAERIRQRFEQTVIPSLRFPITASFGLATFRPDDTAASLFQRADAALYRAKRAGRNRVVVA